MLGGESLIWFDRIVDGWKLTQFDLSAPKSGRQAGILEAAMAQPFQKTHLLPLAFSNFVHSLAAIK